MVDLPVLWTANLVALGTACLFLLTEWIHYFRVRRLACLAFGPKGRAAIWARFAPIVRVCAWSALAWSLTVLLLLEPRVHRAQTVAPEDYKHVVMVLDVSPSMRLGDAGPTKDQSRMRRASEIMESFFQRVSIEEYKLSVIAVYTGAKPVVEETVDVDVVRNIMNDLPMHYAFPVGKTDLFAGLEEASKLARGWKPRSTTVLVISDGDTVPATGMPTMPASVSKVVMVGVGDPITGKFIDGRQSRQDASTLRQVAARLNGVYHNGNEHHLSTDLLKQLTATGKNDQWFDLSLREAALALAALSSSTLAILPILLFYAGMPWRWLGAVGYRGAAGRMGIARPSQPISRGVTTAQTNEGTVSPTITR